jgi:hypothetical protein
VFLSEDDDGHKPVAEAASDDHTHSAATESAAGDSSAAPASETPALSDAPADQNARDDSLLTHTCLDTHGYNHAGVTGKLCGLFLKHAGAIAGGLTHCKDKDFSLETCARELRGALDGTPTPAVAELPATWAARWKKARENPAAGAPAAAMAKHHPALWHNLVSWSPQLVAAAYPATGGPVEERRRWRHGKREPGHFAKPQGSIVERPEGFEDREKVCEENVDAIRFLPFSGTMRVLFEAELVLGEADPELQDKIKRGFTPLTSFHSVWGFKEARACALTRLGGEKHPAISTSHVASWDKGAWMGYIDNTTGTTEAVRSWRNIVKLALGTTKTPVSWIDFLWKILPAKSKSVARHVTRAFNEYNAWIGQTAFTACAHALVSEIADSPLIKLPPSSAADSESNKPKLVVSPALPAPWTMPAVADCSRSVLGPKGDRCGETMKHGLEVLAGETGTKSTPAPGHALDQTTEGLLPSVLCVHTVGVSISSVDDARATTAALSPYHRLAAAYARSYAGACRRSILVVGVGASKSVIREALDSRRNPARPEGEGVPGFSQQGDRVLRLLGVDAVKDFPLVAPADILIKDLSSGDGAPTADEAHDKALGYAVQFMFEAPLSTSMDQRGSVVRSEQFADGVSRLVTLGIPGNHVFFDYVAMIPADVTFVPTNFYRFATRRDVSAALHVLRIPRIIGSRSVAKDTPGAAHRFFIMDNLMYTALRWTLFTPTCQVGDHPGLDVWRCIAQLRMKVTAPTEDGAPLIAGHTDRKLSPFAFAVLEQDDKEAMKFWAPTS